MPGVQVGVGYIDIKPDMSGFSRQLKTEVGRGVSAAGADAGKSLKTSLAGAAKGAAAAFGAAFAAVKITDFLGSAVDAASNLNESLSKSNAVFKGSGAGIEAWAKTAADNIGLSKQAALEAAGGFGNMFIQLGIGTDQAARMSEKIVELGVDFRSFTNAKIEDVLAAQSAAFRGEYDSLQKFLPLISAATVEQRALALTGKRTTKELTAQDKALAVNALMFEGAGDAAGDYKRTQDSLANQQQETSAKWEDAKAQLGEGLIPVMKSLAEILNNEIIPAFKTLFLSEGADPTGWAATIRDVIGDTVGFLFRAFADLSRVVATVISAFPGGWGEGAADNLRNVADGADEAAVRLHASTGELLAWNAADAGTPASVFGAAVKGWLPDLKTSTGLIKGSAAALRELGKAGRDAAAGERDVRDARADLAKLLATGAVDEEKVADARRSLADATRSLASANRNLADVQEDYNEAAAAAGILGTDTALEALEDASDGLADAKDGVASAAEREADAQKELREALAGDPEYQDKLAAARDRVADATDKVATNTDALAKLTPSLTGAMDGTTGAFDRATGAADKFNTELGYTQEQIQELLDLTGGDPTVLDPLLSGLLSGSPTPPTAPTTPAAQTGAPGSTKTVQVDMTVLGPAPDPGLLGKAIAWVI